MVDGVDLPSDYQGVLWLPYDDSGAWRDQLAKELSAAGIEFDSQGLTAAAEKTNEDISSLLHLGKMRSLKDLA